MKTRTLLIAAAMLLALSAAAFGQAIYTVSSTPVTTVIKTGNAELAGAITFTNSTGAASVTGTISIQYSGGVNITSNFSPSASNPITVTSTGGVVVVDQTASIYSPGLLVLDVPLGYTGPITVSGVRVQINGTGLTNVSATISATGNLIQAGNTVVTVINGIADGITSVASYVTTPLKSANAGAPSLASATGYLSPSTTDNFTSQTIIAVKEGFLNAFTKGVGVRITVSAIPPKGVSFTFPGTATSYDSTGNSYAVNPNWVLGNTAGGATGASSYKISSSSTDSGALSVYYYVATDTTAAVTGESVNVEYLEIPVVVTSSAPSTTPFPATTFTYTVSLAPVLNAYNRDGVPGTLAAPRFAASEVGPANLLTVAPSTTTLLMPYVSAGGGFDTGIAVANTTEDPGSTAMGINAAVPQAGTITFYFFPQNNTTATFSYTTSATSPGTGLTTTGTVQAGGNYVVLLSQLVNAAGQGSTFQGYILVVANFTNAHGVYTVSNFTTLAAYSTLMPVLSNRLGLPEPVVF